VLNSVGAAALISAGQLGFGYGLGILRWDADFSGAAGANATPGAWTALLTWVAFIAIVSVLGGARIGRRAIRRPGRRDTLGQRAVAALGAAIGAGLTVPLVWVPARAAQPPFPVDPDLVAIIASVAGILVGLVAAVFALSAPPIAGSMLISAAWVWLFVLGWAVFAAIDPAARVAAGRGEPRLGVLGPPLVPADTWWFGPNLMILLAFVIGVGVAGMARFGGQHKIVVALSGFAGPAVIAAAYLIAGPGSGAGRAAQFEPYRAALIAAGAGLVASVVVAFIQRPGTKEPAAAEEEAEALPPVRPVPPPVPERDSQYVDWLKDLGPPLTPSGTASGAAAEGIHPDEPVILSRPAGTPRHGLGPDDPTLDVGQADDKA